MMESGSLDLKARMLNVLNQKANTDVIFIVGEEKEELVAHSHILAAASDAFVSMFSGEFAEKPSVAQPAIVDVPDGTPDGFRSLLKYIYADQADFTIDNIGSVLYLSKKYLLHRVYRHAIFYAKHQINASTVVRFLHLSEFFEELQSWCFEVFHKNKNKETLMGTQEFMELSLELRDKLLRREFLLLFAGIRE